MGAAAFALGVAVAFVLGGATGFLAAVDFLGGAALFFAAAGGLRVFDAFLAAGRDFGVFAAFFAADFLEADFDFAMSLLPRNPPDQAFTCLSTNSTIRPNMSPHFDKSGDEPA
jgi:hypothetical protein